MFGHQTISSQYCIFLVKFIAIWTPCQDNLEYCTRADEQPYNSGILLNGLLTINLKVQCVYSVPPTGLYTCLLVVVSYYSAKLPC